MRNHHQLADHVVPIRNRASVDACRSTDKHPGNWVLLRGDRTHDSPDHDTPVAASAATRVSTRTTDRGRREFPDASE